MNGRQHADHLRDMVVAADEKTLFAVIRALEIVGEASKRIPATVRQRHPELPWRTMSGMRDRLIHDYSGTDPEVMWRTVKEDLPDLIPALQALAQEEA